MMLQDLQLKVQAFRDHHGDYLNQVFPEKFHRSSSWSMQRGPELIVLLVGLRLGVITKTPASCS